MIVEFSKNVENPQIAIFGMQDKESKSVKIYKVNIDKLDFKLEHLKVGEVSRNVEENKKVIEQSKLLCELKFYNKESIESLMYVLKEVYSLFEEESELIKFAKRELEILQNNCKDEESRKLQSAINKDVLDIVECFSKQGHNKRCPRIFKDEQGRSYDIEGKIFTENNGKTWFTSKDSRVYIDFPYIPKSEKVFLKRGEENNV